MKKKLCLALILGAVCLTLFGCGQNNIQSRVLKNMAEKTDVYFMGQGQAFYATLSSGTREEKYFVDGNCDKPVEFALLSVHISNFEEQVLEASIKIDETVQEVELQRGDINSAFMVDLECSLSGNEVIELSVQNETISLENLSKDFGVDSKQAIEIACSQLGEQILQKRHGSKLNAECYLRVLDKVANNFDEVFWCFTVVNIDGQTYSVVFSAQDGHVLAKTE